MDTLNGSVEDSSKILVLPLNRKVEPSLLNFTVKVVAPVAPTGMIRFPDHVFPPSSLSALGKELLEFGKEMPTACFNVHSKNGVSITKAKKKG